MVPAYGGEGEVLTTPTLNIYLTWLSENVGGLKENGFELYNCTEGGARVEGWTEVPLSKLPVDGRVFSLQDLIGAIDVAPKIDGREIVAALREHKSRVVRIGKLRKEAAKIARKLERLDSSLMTELRNAKLLNADVSTGALNIKENEPMQRTLAVYETIAESARRINTLTARALEDHV